MAPREEVAQARVFSFESLQAQGLNVKLLIFHAELLVLVEQFPAGDTGVIGPGGPLARDLVELGYLPRSANVKPGQLVRTSGEGGVFPKGIPVGTILDAQPVEYGLYTVARVKLAADLNALETVWVLGLTNDAATPEKNK